MISRSKICKVYSRQEILSRNTGRNSKVETDTEAKLKQLNVYKHGGTSRGKNNKYSLLRILNWNIEGFKNVIANSPEKDLFKDTDLIILTETFCTDEQIQIPGYYKIESPAEKPNAGRPKGGIAVFYKPFLSLHQVSIQQNKIQAQSILGNILCYYFHPDTSTEDITEEITQDLSSQDTQTSIVIGDFNCRIDKHTQKGNTLVQLMQSYGFQLVSNPNIPTYIAHNGSSC